MHEVLGIAAAVAGCALLMWFASRIEPHWPSKDGESFTCAARPLTPDGAPLGRWREVRCTLGADRTVVVERRNVLAPGPRTSSQWRLAGRDPQSPKNKVIYLLDGNPDTGQMEFRIPANSRCVAVLDRRLGLEASTST